jgi:hypothetical protein
MPAFLHKCDDIHVYIGWMQQVCAKGKEGGTEKLLVC